MKRTTMRRRLTAAGLATGALLSMSTIAGPTASADCWSQGVNGGCTITGTRNDGIDPGVLFGGVVQPIEESSEQPGQDVTGVIVVGGARRLPDKAISDVLIYLTQPSCRALIKGASSFDPEAVYRAVPIQDIGGIHPTKPGTLTESPVGAGPNGFINVYRAWHDVVFRWEDFPALDPTKLTRTPSPEEMRSLSLLHELAHLTGALGPHPSPDTGKAFNHWILERCIGVVRA